MARIFYLENDENDVFLLRIAFRREGYQDAVLHFEQLADLQAALAAPGTERPSVFLFDLKLNGETGLDTLRWVKETPEFASIPAFLFSSGTVAAEILKSMDLDVSAYIFKPMDREGWSEVAKYLAYVAGLTKLEKAATTPQKDPA